MSCYFMFVMLCYVMLCYVMLCYVMLCYVILFYFILFYFTLCYVTLRYIMLCFLCYAMLCYVLLCCYVMHCCIMFCYVLLCYVMFDLTKLDNYYFYYVARNYYCTTRLTILLQSVLFCVSSTSLFMVFVAFDRSSLIQILLRSCRIVCIHVVFDLPCGLLTFLRYSSKAFLAGVSGCSLIICPNHVNRLIFI